MSLTWFLVAGIVLLALGLAALTFDTIRKSGNSFPHILADLTTRLMRSSPAQHGSQSPSRSGGVHPQSQIAGRQVGGALHRLRVGPRIVPVVLVAALLAGCAALATLVVAGNGTQSQAGDGGVVVGVSPFRGAPPTGSPTEAFGEMLLKAAAGDGVPNLTLRASRKTVSTAEEAEVERARIKADMLWWGEVGADGTLTASVALAPNFTPGQPPWNRLRATDMTQFVFPDAASLRLQPGKGVDPMLPLTLALAHMKLGNFAAGAKAAYGARATLEQARAGASGQQLAILLESAGDFGTKKYPDAVRDFDAWGSLGDMSPEASVNRAAARLVAGDAAGAKTDADKALASRDASNTVLARAYMLRGRASLALNDPTLALSDLQESGRLDPTYDPAGLDRAEALYRQSQADLARSQLQTVIGRAPTAAPPYRLMGLTQLMLGQPEDALKTLAQPETLYNRWIESLRADEGRAQAVGDPVAAQNANDSILDLRKELAGIYLYQGMAWADIARRKPPETFLGGIWRRIRGEPTELARALGRMQEAERLDAQRADVPLQMASVYTQMGDAASAAQQLAAAQKLNPTAPEPYIALARLQQSQNNPREAIATLQQLVSRNPAYYTAYDELYKIYTAAGDSESAKAVMQQALNVPARTAMDHLWRARFLRTLGDNSGATTEAKSAALDPQLWEAHLLLGQLLQGAGQAPEALAQFKQVLGVQPNNAEALLGAGRMLVLAGQVDEAQKLFERLVAMWPDYADGHLALLELLMSKGQLDKAVAEGQRAVQVAGDRADTHFALGLAYEAQQQWASATDQFKATTERDPQQFDAFIRWGRALFLQDKYKEAIEVSRSAIALRGNDPQPYRWKAQAQLALGDPVGALASLADAVKLAPQNPDVLALAARAYTAAGDQANAATFANLAVRADPRNLTGPLALGEYQLASNNPNDALQAFTSALAISPRSAEATTGQGRAYAALGDQAKALQAYAAAVAADPRYAPARLYAGRSYVAMGRWNEALEQYRAAVQLRPQWPDALNDLGRAYLQRKDLQDAQAAFSKATQVAPNLVDAWYGLGIASRDKGQQGDAIKALGNAVNLNQNFAEGWLYLGLTYEEAGQRDLAASAFTRARDTTQDPAIRQQAEKGLSRVK